MIELRELLAGHGGWALGVALGFPLALLLLTEVSLALERAGRPLAPLVRRVRNWFLPLVAGWLVLRIVLGRPGEDLWVRLVETACWVMGVVLTIGFINTAVFETAQADSWRSRVPRRLRDLVGVLLVAVAAALVYQFVWGRELQGAFAALGLSSIVVGLALQEPLGNLFSGLVLLMERPFEVGDAIAVGKVAGRVREVNWRSAHIVSTEGVVQIVPNSTLNKETINNFSKPISLRAAQRARPAPIRSDEIEVGFGYQDPPNKVREILLGLARSTEGVLAEPQPKVRILRYGDSAIQYRLVYRVGEEGKGAVRTELLARLWYLARRQGLTIPYPVRVNLNHPESEPFEKTAPTPREQLAHFPRIPQLSEEGQAPSATQLAFGKGEVVFKDGDPLEGVYLIVSGVVSLQLPGAAGATELGVVHAGEFFGLAGMYGRQLAESRAVALEDCELVLLGPETVRSLFEASPRLARETGQALDVRRKALRSALAALRKRSP